MEGVGGCKVSCSILDRCVTTEVLRWGDVSVT